MFLPYKILVLGLKFSLLQISISTYRYRYGIELGNKLIVFRSLAPIRCLGIVKEELSLEEFSYRFLT